MNNMSRQDLRLASVGFEAPRYADGKQMEPEDLQDAYLVPSGKGKYLVSMSDPSTREPQFLEGGNEDGLYEIDMDQLIKGRRRLND
jgi:hypothetical protein